MYPAELVVHNDASGRPYVTGRHGRELPPLEVSIAHCAEAGVAYARRTPPHGEGAGGPGIDIQEIDEPADATVATALTEAERELLAARQGTDAGARALWFTRFWAAKEAVAKAEGTGFAGRPRDFEVTRARADRLTVTVRPSPGPSGGPSPSSRTYQVSCERVGNPPGLPPRAYVVAWTTGPDPDPPGAAPLRDERDQT